MLYSYTPRPNTTVYAGYGDVYLIGVDAFYATPRDGLQALRRTVFLKLSVNWKAR